MDAENAAEAIRRTASAAARHIATAATTAATVMAAGGAADGIAVVAVRLSFLVRDIEK